ncbi:MAG TPA: S24/S26 family peptidase [Candidatus Mediterraneibacter stercorigallinarum]|uniref:S24/S26 family peptidase n=1 Tax=Candidatus Mediterraneibacter stercorigallinarum TaxID=2838686 RepID=A0A9D2DAE3_9FIRM|nr:S24/S26 family peptidase [Candidatus Mediterraneibacter stercorigallinarum]
MDVKQVDTREYVSVLREIAEEGKVVSMLIAGSSMAPFLCHNRDYIYFTRPERELRRGDMVFYQRDGGRYVMHRIYKIKPDGYYMVGDAQTQIEGPLRRDQIFALIIQAKRKGKMIRPGDFWWEFFEHVWIRIVPARRVMALLYGILAGKIH